MYATFFGLQQPPFSIAPDPRYLYMSERHREALAHLLYGLGGGGGFVLLSGEIGAGKTTVCRCFLEQLPEGTQVAYVFNPRLTATELLQTVCDEFGLAVAPPPAGQAPTVKPYIDALNAHLLAAHARGRQCLLVIDEAQNLSPEVLEQLRLLTNLETAERKLLQIVLIGQPELRSLLAGPGLEQLAQRVIARYHLGPLGPAETAAYVAHRLAVAGHAGASPFDAAALRRIHALSGGVPRRINLLCDRALLGAYAEGRARVDRRIVERAAREVFDPDAAPPRAGRRRLALAAGGGLLAGLALAAGWLGWLHGGGWPAGRGNAAAQAAAPGVAASRPAVAPAQMTPASSSMATASRPAASAAAALAPAPASGPAASTLVPPAAAAVWPPPLAPPVDLGWLPRDDRAAWRELLRQWGLPEPAPGADPCAAVRVQGWRCFRTGTLTLAQLRRLGRSGVLALRGDDGAPRHARLTVLGTDRAVLHAGARAHTLGLDELAQRWRGEFGTLWRPPEGYAGPLEPGARGPAVDALARGLAGWRRAPAPPAGQALSGPLAADLAAFQRAQGWRADGVAGPATFMLLERAAGLAGPGRLAEPPAPETRPER